MNRNRSDDRKKTGKRDIGRRRSVRRGPAAAVQRNRGGVQKRMLKPVETAILGTVPEEAPGITFDDMVDQVAKRLNPMVFPLRRTVSRYAKVAQLDLERRGLIERVPGKSPLRLRRLKRR
jgi:hypothetical protein